MRALPARRTERRGSNGTGWQLAIAFAQSIKEACHHSVEGFVSNGDCLLKNIPIFALSASNFGKEFFISEPLISKPTWNRAENFHTAQ
ncbi:hypothetical protein [Methylobacterium flocculans]|uniref:hypothetical protein n=1 Tax=Methylobacterium flocculans TaxID=2984843 RepID=UPI0021F2ABDF|nr:hypothetical protein [Methylobacterium sp. FF17]